MRLYNPINMKITLIIISWVLIIKSYLYIYYVNIIYYNVSVIILTLILHKYILNVDIFELWYTYYALYNITSIINLTTYYYTVDGWAQI